MNLRLVTTPPDRRATRLLAASHRQDSFGPQEISGIDALALVIAVYGADRLSGRGDARISDRALRDAVRRLAAEARARDPERAEQMLIDLRRMWLQLPTVRSMPYDSPRSDLWDRVVTLSCEEFYSPADASAGDPQSQVMRRA